MSVSIFISSLRQNVPSLPSNPSLLHCVLHTRFGRQFWTDEKGDKEEVLVVSIDTYTPSSRQGTPLPHRSHCRAPDIVLHRSLCRYQIVGW